MPKRIILAALPMMLVACASMPDAQEPPEQRTFLTVSHLPVRDKQTSAEITNIDPKTLLFRAPYIPKDPAN